LISSSKKGENASSDNTEESKLDGLTGGVTGRVKDFSEKAGSRLQEGLATTLGRFGIPTRDEIQALTRSVEQLTEKVKTMQEEKVA